MRKPYVLGIDVGGQSAKLGIVDQQGKILNQTVIKSNTQTTPQQFIDELAEAIKSLISTTVPSEQIQGIGVGAPNGNYYTGTIDNAPNLTWATAGKVEFAKMLSEATGLPVALTNDANAAAIGEMTYGVARDLKDFIMITLGTGVGSGIVINNQLLYGHDGFAGELGHTCAIPGGRQCNCGKVGCLETYASATGVARTAREILENSDRETPLRNIPKDEISSKHVYDAAVQGDPVALEIFQFTGEILGRKFADFVAFSAPEAIVLFGGLTKAGKFIYDPIVKSMNNNLLPIWKNKIKVLFSTLKESDAAILGASALAWDL